MSPAIPQLRPLCHPPARRGFSFAEVMFAVVILGIGFIMVAGIFPVALQQTQATSQQASAAAFAKNAAGIMQQVASYDGGLYIPSSQPEAAYGPYVYPFDSLINASNTYTHGSWLAVSGQLIAPDDPRYAFVPLYLRSANANFSQLVVVNVAVQNHTTYDPTDDLLPNVVEPPIAYIAATLRPKLVQVSVAAGSPQIATFTTGTPTALGTDHLITHNFIFTPNGSLAVGTGTYVIIANDNIVTGAATNLGPFNGKIYRVGNQRLDLSSGGNAWELIPGADLVPQTLTAGAVTTTYSTLTSADAWIVGRGLQPSTANYAGGVQDLSLYTTFLSIPQ